jgi:hypothetical protein
LYSPADLKAVAHFLRNKSGIKLRVGVLNGKRVDYFKGTRALTPSRAVARELMREFST